MKKEKQKEKKLDNLFWADQVAEQVIKEKGRKERYVCASAVSPSGTIHFGNFREVITSEIIRKALEDRGKKVRFIFTWDDYDRYRKTPANVPKSFDKYIGAPYCFIPDPFKCHKSYAEHFEQIFEAELKRVNVMPEFIRQHERYRKCAYAEEIKFALNNREKIRKILDRHRTEPLEQDWYPVEVFCEKCRKDTTKVIDYDGRYNLKYKCKCGFEGEADFRKKGIVKLLWRIDWPMKWVYEQVDFEPGGKEHSTPGGSITTGREIVEEVWNKKPPVYKKYEYIILKGVGGKMSGSLGNVITLTQVLEIYEPEIVRFMFAGTRPAAEFSVSFDLDVLKTYEDFDSCERIYYGKQEAKDEKDLHNKKRIYEISAINPRKQMPFQAQFRHLTTILQVYENDFKKVEDYFKKELKSKNDEEKLRKRASCAWNWLQKYAPEEMRFTVQKNPPKLKPNENERKVLQGLIEELKKKTKEEKLAQRIYDLCNENNVKPKDFFKLGYKILLNKERGPRLASFMLILGERAIKLFEAAI